jgi:orotidine-5'-phosphate decarboxylase
MSAVRELQKAQSRNNSIICLGLDLDPKRMPQEYAKTPKTLFDFVHRIIDATADLVCAYKPNIAFYERLGADGISLLRQITNRIPNNIPVILDAKRGDIGNTAAHYAHALFDNLGAHWVTLNPYMGYDSLRPFLEYKDRGVFVLCLTSNPGSKDFQLLELEGSPLYKIVAEKVSYWNKEHNCGLVAGATHPDQLREIRQLAGDMPLLIPGVGAQGGSLEKAAVNGTSNFQKLAVINVCRSVLYASKETGFAQKARQELDKLRTIVESLRGRPKEQATSTGPPEEGSDGGTVDNRPSQPEARQQP